MKRYKYTGTESFNGGHFTLAPGEIIDGGHPAVAFGVGNLEELTEDPDIRPEPARVEDEDGEPDRILSEEY